MQISSRSAASLPRPVVRRQLVKRVPLRVAASAVALPATYGYVIASTAFTAGVLQWQAIKVAFARRKYGVKYPTMYADGDGDDARIFNCTQRAHQNTLETAPAMTVMACMLGLIYPATAAALLTVWSVGRIFYALGYSTGDPGKRGPGAGVSALVFLGTIITTLVAGLRAALV